MLFNGCTNLVKIPSTLPATQIKDGCYEYMFGTCSSLATFGEIKDEIVMIDGKEQVRKICEFGINIDERVADGFYFAKCIKMCEHLFKHPEMLEEKVGTKIEIGNIR